MGGLLILISVAVSVLLWMDLTNPYVWACLLVTGGFGLIGFLDDYDKVKKAHHAGLSGKMRLLLEFADRRLRHLADRPHRRHRPLSAVRPGPGDRPRLVLHRLRRVRDRRVRQCGEPDRRARRARDHAGDHRQRSPSCSSPTSSATRKFATYLGIPHVLGRRRSDRAAAWRSSARASPSCGSTRRRRRSSWATPAASRWAARSARSRSPRHHEFVLGIIGGLFVVEALSASIIQVAGLQAHRQARLPDGADPPPFRASRLVRADRRDPLLDHQLRAGAGRPVDAEAAGDHRQGLRRQALRRLRPRALGPGDGRGAARERGEGDGVGREGCRRRPGQAAASSGAAALDPASPGN